MKLSIDMREKHFLFLVGLVAVVSAIGIAIGQVPSPGHPAIDIGPGTFAGGGNYIFPSGSNLNIQGNLVMGGHIENIKIECPQYFTSIESQGRQLGCMQENHQGTNNWDTAAADCFTSYGGRLPHGVEWYIAMENYNLNGETGSYEWMADQDYLNRHLIVGASSIQDETWNTDNVAYNYRCFIPN